MNQGAAPRSPGISRLVRDHWRGELSIGRVLVFCPLLTLGPLALALGLVLALEVVAASDQSRQARLLFNLGWVGSLLAIAWWCWGAHRKALNLMEQGRMWAAGVIYTLSFAASGLLVLVLAPETYVDLRQEYVAYQARQELDSRDRLSWVHKPWTVMAHPDLKRISASGDIGWGSAKALEAVILRHPEIRVLELDSPGGLVHEEELLISLVLEHQLDTVVLNRCASACTGVFLAGQRRYISSYARFGFHRSGYWGTQKNAPWATPEYMTAIFNRERGVSEEFTAKALGTPYESIWRPLPLEVKQARFATEWWADRSKEYR